jgi:hypothetical protein
MCLVSTCSCWLSPAETSGDLVRCFTLPTKVLVVGTLMKQMRWDWSMSSLPKQGRQACVNKPTLAATVFAVANNRTLQGVHSIYEMSLVEFGSQTKLEY